MRVPKVKKEKRIQYYYNIVSQLVKQVNEDYYPLL